MAALVIIPLNPIAMTENLIAKVSVIINAPVSKVWNTLTDPGQVKQCLSGGSSAGDWKKGSPVAYTGIWEGRTEEDKGMIVGIVPEKLLHTAWFSYLSGQEDKPENYANIIYEVSPENGRTLMTITQDHIENKGDLEHMQQAWGTVLAGMKNGIE
jgi:uncharacterized protein YndB with AHSA1/START domain